MGSNDAPRLPANSVIPSLETISIDDTERKIVALADSAQTLLEAVHTDVNEVTVDARQLIANLNGITGKPNQQHISEILTNADAMVTRISPKIDQIGDQLLKLTNDANGVMAKMGPAVDNVNATVSNANDTITAVRDPLQTDLAEMRKDARSGARPDRRISRRRCGRKIRTSPTRSRTFVRRPKT